MDHIQTHIYSLHNPSSQRLKRIIDVTISIITLICIFPIAFLFIGCILKMTMPGSIIFKQKRTGKDGKEFTCYKFRTMLPHAEADTMQVKNEDPRITRFGRFLRTTSLDELPQFWNVLRGEMSVVGPRPHMLAHTEHYQKLIPQYDKRLTVKPGITGWAQIHNLRGETYNLCKMEQRVEYDLWYIRNWSLLLDIEIMFRTLSIMF